MQMTRSAQITPRKIVFSDAAKVQWGFDGTPSSAPSVDTIHTRVFTEISQESNRKYFKFITQETAVEVLLPTGSLNKVDQTELTVSLCLENRLQLEVHHVDYVKTPLRTIMRVPRGLCILAKNWSGGTAIAVQIDVLACRQRATGSWMVRPHMTSFLLTL